MGPSSDGSGGPAMLVAAGVHFAAKQLGHGEDAQPKAPAAGPASPLLSFKAKGRRRCAEELVLKERGVDGTTAIAQRRVLPLCTRQTARGGNTPARATDAAAQDFKRTCAAVACVFLTMMIVAKK